MNTKKFFILLILSVFLSLAAVDISLADRDDSVKYDDKEKAQESQNKEEDDQKEFIPIMQEIDDFEEDAKSDAQADGRNPQTGKEIQIAAKSTTSYGGGAGKVSVQDIKFSSSTDVSCSAGEANIYCSVEIDGDNTLWCWGSSCEARSRPESDDSLWCWGRSCPANVAECPSCQEEYERVRTQRVDSTQWAVSRPDMTRVISSIHYEEEVYLVIQSSAEIKVEEIDLDDEFIRVEPRSENGEPVEALSLSFTKIEMSTGDDGSDVAEVAADKRITDGEDCDDEDCTIHPAGEITGDGEVKPIVISARIDKATPKLIQDVSSKNVDSEDKESIREYLRNQSELRGADFGLAVALVASENERVRSIHYDEERNVVEIQHEEEMRLFGLFKVKANSKTIVHEDGTEETRRPWWSFLASGKQAESSGSGRFGYSVEEGKKL